MNFRNRIDRLERMFGGDDRTKKRHALFAALVAKKSRSLIGTSEPLSIAEKKFIFRYLQTPNTGQAPERD